MAREQIPITLGDYDKWAVERIAEARHEDRTELIKTAVKEWIARYPDTVAAAKATLADFASTDLGRSDEWKSRKRGANGR